MKTINTGPRVRALNQIIGVARDGHDLYARGVADMQDSDPDLSALLMRMAESSARVVDRVSGLVRREGGRPVRHGTIIGHVRGYFGWLGTVLGDAGIQYLSEGQASEARLIRVMEAAVRHGDLGEETYGTLDAMLRDTRLYHDDMRGRLDTMRARDP
ncbi:PA2169 family four-helix-bundle protein [Stenotrophomonas sp.]|uniref:PA2169 family four-helix-bundle protein n=1 Tax=unclassified Stenotrophomonas TaxID=196198 RepID=UPI0019A92DCC|nr:PA2169 family four-helix-bundle protein [Stenotrophomonas sp.]MBD3826162.1 PA2169 family four-helix-bundle protein [Stenotrophomonas sp.]